MWIYYNQSRVKIPYQHFKPLITMRLFNLKINIFPGWEIVIVVDRKYYIWSSEQAAFSLEERASYCGFLWSWKLPSVSESHSFFPHFYCLSILICLDVTLWMLKLLIGKKYETQQRRWHCLCRRRKSKSKPPKIAFNRVIVAEAIELAMAHLLYPLQPFEWWKGMQPFFLNFG